MGLEIRCHVIGPRQAFVDHGGDWARGCEISDTGVVLVRPDHHVAWRAQAMADDPQGDLHRVLSAVLARPA